MVQRLGEVARRLLIVVRGFDVGAVGDEPFGDLVHGDGRNVRAYEQPDRGMQRRVALPVACVHPRAMGDEIIDELGIELDLRPRGPVKRRPAFEVDRVDVGAFGEKELDQPVAVGKGGLMQRGIALQIARVDVRPALDQKSRNFGRILGGGEHQRRRAVLRVVVVDRDPLRNEPLHRLQIAAPGGVLD